MRTGLDYSHYRPTMPSLRAHGISFVVRYMLPDSMSTSNPPKGLSLLEAQTLSNADIDIVCNFEFAPDGMARGASQGKIDANIVLVELARCRVPKSTPPRPVYFSADWDVQPAQVPAMLEYLKAAAAILRPAGFEVGTYGGLRAIKATFDAGYKWGWQTFAWSGTPKTIWDARAQLRQIINNSLFGGQVDTNVNTTDDFGQWDLNKVEGAWQTPLSIVGVGSYAPANLLGEIFMRSGERGAITEVMREVKAIHAETGQMAADIRSIKDILEMPRVSVPRLSEDDVASIADEVERRLGRGPYQ